MTYLICRNKVADFDQWKPVFDSHAQAQREAGLHVQHVWRNIDDSNEVFMLFEVHDLAKAQAFVTSPKVPEAKRQSGVVGQPDLFFVR